MILVTTFMKMYQFNTENPMNIQIKSKFRIKENTISEFFFNMAELSLPVTLFYAFSIDCMLRSFTYSF